LPDSSGTIRSVHGRAQPQRPRIHFSGTVCGGSDRLPEKSRCRLSSQPEGRQKKLGEQFTYNPVLRGTHEKPALAANFQSSNFFALGAIPYVVHYFLRAASLKTARREKKNMNNLCCEERSIRSQSAAQWIEVNGVS
jgi:hypothetical protein